MKKILQKLIFPTLALILSAQSLYSQDYLDIIKQSPPNSNFETVKVRANEYFDGITDPVEKNRAGYKHWKRWEWFAQQHLDPDGRVGAWTEYNDIALAKLRLSTGGDMGAGMETASANGNWFSQGPSSISNNQDYLGRVECIAFHPSDANTIYVGSATGGVWKTTNLGGSWTAMSDYLPSLSIGGIAVHPSNGNIIYALTGDGDGGNQWGYYVKERGSGVFRSNDGGLTWAPTGLSFDRSTQNIMGYKLIINPTNGNNLLAATSAGIYRTTNGGADWVLEQAGEFQDIEFRPGNTNSVAAIRWNVDDIYTSTDNGQSWTARDLPGISDITRGELAVSANASGNVYILCGPQVSGGFRGLFRYRWSDNDITMISNTPNVFNGAADGAGGGGFPWWCIAFAISPTDVNNMLIGGVRGRRSTDAGVTIFDDNDILHADAHGYAYSPVDGSVYAMNDGGLFRSTNNGNTWANLTTGIRITQFYRISGTPENIHMILGGTQDNGHYVRYASSTAFKHTLTCCDGMDNAVDPTNSSIIYMNAQDGGLNRSTDGGDTWNNISPQGSSWVAPTALHTTTPTTIFFAGNTGVWRSTNSGISGWVNLGSDGRGAIAQGTSNSSRFYAANNGLSLQRSDDINAADPTWTTISGNTGWPTTGMSNSQITSLDVNPDNSTEVWLTLSGYNAANKVLRSTNSGTNWTNMTAGLPNLPVHVIKFKAPEAGLTYEVYVGTDIGVFYRNNTMSDWRYYNNGLPRVMVTDLYLNGTYIYAGTYGRGIFRSDLHSACAANLSFGGSLDGEWIYQAATSIIATSDITGGTGTNILFRSPSITLSPGFDVTAGNIFTAQAGPCNNTLSNSVIVPFKTGTKPIIKETEIQKE